MPVFAISHFSALLWLPAAAPRHRQELDGVSFMLLTWSALTEVLQLSERDALALCTHVSRVKYTYFTAFSG